MNKKTIILLTLSILLITGCSKKESNINKEQAQEEKKIEKTIEESSETINNENQNNDHSQESDNTHENTDSEESTPINEEEENPIFQIPKDEEKVQTDKFVIFNSYNAFSITWVGEDDHKYYKLYASSKPEGNYGFIKDVIKEEGQTDPYSVTLENFELNSNVYIKITSIIEEDNEDIESQYGSIIHYSSKKANELNNDELSHHLILKFPIIASDDQHIMFRFYDRYIIEETEDEITISSNLKGDHIDLFDQSMNSEYKDEIIHLISQIYTYVHDIRDKKIVGIIEDKLTITVNEDGEITVELK